MTESRWEEIARLRNAQYEIDINSEMKPYVKVNLRDGFTDAVNDLMAEIVRLRDEVAELRREIGISESVG